MPSELIEEAKIWQRRAGGRSLRSFPNILSALRGLEERLPMMRKFHVTAQKFAAKIGEIPEVSVSPQPPHANAFFVSFKGNKAIAHEVRDRVASETGLRLFEEKIDCVDQSLIRFEVTIRAAGVDVDEKLVVNSLERFLGYCSE